MALSSAQMELINDASPINNDFSLGNRWKYLTTAGYYSSGTIQGPAISSGTASGMEFTLCETVSFDVPAATGSQSSAYWTSAAGITKGAWQTTWAYVYLATDPSSGDVVTLINAASGTTVIIETCSAAAAGVAHIGSATDNRVATLIAGKTAVFWAKDSTYWMVLSDTAAFTSWGAATG